MSLPSLSKHPDPSLRTWFPCTLRTPSTPSAGRCQVSSIRVHLDDYNFLPYLTDVTEKVQRQVFHYLNDEGMPVGVRDNGGAKSSSLGLFQFAIPVRAFISANEIQFKWDSNVSCPIKNNRPCLNK
jgi:hypothetical protein